MTATWIREFSDHRWVELPIPLSRRMVHRLQSSSSKPTTMDATMGSIAPTGLKGKLAALEDFISMQNEELAAQRQEIESLRGDKAGIEEHYQGQLQELKKTMVGDVQRLQDEVKRHFAQQKAENARLQQQITTLKGEKTSLQQQILGLQRRIQEIEEQVGAD
ncbi:ALKBH3 [Symbiodinium sp. CCMP2456]|nr:ALKBH3 [Symbiodinium sp. CCMP2456]